MLTMTIQLLCEWIDLCCFALVMPSHVMWLTQLAFFWYPPASISHVMTAAEAIPLAAVRFSTRTRDCHTAALPTHQSMCTETQVQGLPGALPAQLVRPTAGTVTWLLDADSAAGVAAEKWSDDPKAYPRRCAVHE